MRLNFRKQPISGGIVLTVLSTAALAQTPDASVQQTPTPQTQGQRLPQDVPQSKGPDESQPQGRTGPTDTTSGGAPAESPQGEAPPGMQADPTKPSSQGHQDKR
jgi:hypothetical protein